MHDCQDGDRSSGFVDSIDNAVCTSPSRVAVSQGRVQAFADTLRIVQQGAHDELIRS